MSYVVKWVPLGERNPREWPATFATPSEAVDFAYTVFTAATEGYLDRGAERSSHRQGPDRAKLPVTWDLKKHTNQLAQGEDFL